MLFINNLALEIKKSGIGVKIEEPESDNNNANSPVVDNTYNHSQESELSDLIRDPTSQHVADSLQI